ncbi:MAG: protein kinase [Planctomycetota bacterium]
MVDGSGAKRVVTVVDDDGVTLAFLSKSLRKRGYDVRAYRDPRTAIDQLADDAPEAVITDMRMPHLSGLDVVQQVRSKLNPCPPILVVSGEDDETLLQEAFRSGAEDYLLKPVNETELGVKLERALSNTETRRGPRSNESWPERIGAWTLIDCIGRGGTSCVFTAAREGEERLRAVKIVWPHLMQNTETLLRFRREIDTLAALDHPALVGFVESGREHGHFYYVMDFIPGGTLRRRLRLRGRLSPREVHGIMEQLIAPLSYLHAKGIVHRDVKPGNVFFDKYGKVVLGDFGLARRLPDRGITLDEEFIGTPLYLAPEVFHSAEFNQSVDLYALGVCAFEMLLGRPPVDEPESMRLIGRIMDRGLPKPSEVLGDVPAPFLRVLDDLMSGPDRRPQSAAALAARLAEVEDAF